MTFQKYCIRLLILGMLVFMVISGIAAPQQGKGYAIINATLVTVTGEPIVNGTLVMEGNHIKDVGSEIEIPDDMEVIDASGLFVYPGLIDGYSTLGLSEIGAVAATQDAYETGIYNPHIKTAVALNPHSVHIPITRVNGITAAVVAPSGGVISGQCALIQLKGWTSEEMVLQSPIGIAVSFPHMQTKEEEERARQRQRTPATGAQTSSAKERTEKAIKNLKEVFQKAGRYAAAWDAYAKSQKPPAPDVDLMLEALVPVAKKELAAIISVNTELDIKNAVAFVKELDIKAIFQGVSEGWKVAPLLAENDIPVLVGPVLRSPGPKDPYDSIYANAGVLNKAGVKIAFLTRSAADGRNLPYQAGTASAFGLPKEEALKAVTIYPAEILGVADKLGSLEAGKLANVIVTDGDPLEMRTQIKHLFIAGEKISLETKHTELYEKFRKRPPVK
jgi:imidazolonepropionase-like amidohydrolase